MSSLIKKPLLTEKSLQDATEGRYTFVVDSGADKKSIADEVKKAFNVDVLAVRTRILKGKRRRIRGTRLEKTGPLIKKATVKVGKNQKISVFEVAK
jgi:large subunit ribosomal protein L23